MLCILFSIVAPIFDADEDETWSVGFVRYVGDVWKWLLGGGLWGVLVALVYISRE